MEVISMDTEKILEGLTQEERLELLERLIQSTDQPREENLSVEQRLERLESLIGFGPGHRRWHRPGFGFARRYRHCHAYWD
jgi:hypothetical protein